jgi:FAD:protein FMN transferase
VSGVELEAGFPALGTTAVVLVTDARQTESARVAVQRGIDEIDRTCSRFRPDSELLALNAAAGAPVSVSPTLYEAVRQAVRAARLTDGLVDPTLGRELRELGYDRDFAVVPPDGPPLVVSVRRRSDWTDVRLHTDGHTITVPVGVELDLGATAKALCADRAALAAFEATGVGVLVGLGGDIAVAGPAPGDGWSVRVTDDHAAGPDAPGEDVLIAAGGLATSSTTVRRWVRGGEELHHVLDPARGRPARIWWRTVSVAAATCLDANIATTASILLGPAAPDWLVERGLPARLVRPDGTVVAVAGWPTEDGAGSR